MASIRHNGAFIGWDTDVDLYIHESDVEKLKVAFKVCIYSLSCVTHPALYACRAAVATLKCCKSGASREKCASCLEILKETIFQLVLISQRISSRKKICPLLKNVEEKLRSFHFSRRHHALKLGMKVCSMLCAPAGCRCTNPPERGQDRLKETIFQLVLISQRISSRKKICPLLKNVEEKLRSFHFSRRHHALKLGMKVCSMLCAPAGCRCTNPPERGQDRNGGWGC